MQPIYNTVTYDNYITGEYTFPYREQIFPIEEQSHPSKGTIIPQYGNIQVRAGERLGQNRGTNGHPVIDMY